MTKTGDVHLSIVKNENLGSFQFARAFSCNRLLIGATTEDLLLFSPVGQQAAHYMLRLSKDFFPNNGLEKFMKLSLQQKGMKDIWFDEKPVFLSEKGFRRDEFSSPRIEFFSVEFLGFRNFVSFGHKFSFSGLYFYSDEVTTILTFPDKDKTKWPFIIYPSWCVQPGMFSNVYDKEFATDEVSASKVIESIIKKREIEA